METLFQGNDHLIAKFFMDFINGMLLVVAGVSQLQESWAGSPVAKASTGAKAMADRMGDKAEKTETPAE